MLQFWLQVFERAISESLHNIGREPSDIVFSIIVVLLSFCILLIRDGLRKGWHGMRSRLRKLFEEDAIIVGFLIVFILCYHVVNEPFLMWKDAEDSSNKIQQEYNGRDIDYKTCQSKTEGLHSHEQTLNQFIQQGTVNSLQDTLAKQQAAVTTCVGDLAKAIIPEAQKTTMLLINDDPPSPPQSEHTKIILFITNKETPFKQLFWCDLPLKKVDLMPTNGSIFSGGAEKMKQPNLFQSAPWLLTENLALWEPDNPVLVRVYYDGDDIGACHSRAD